MISRRLSLLSTTALIISLLAIFLLLSSVSIFTPISAKPVTAKVEATDSEQAESRSSSRVEENVKNSKRAVGSSSVDEQKSRTNSTAAMGHPEVGSGNANRDENALSYNLVSSNSGQSGDAERETAERSSGTSSDEHQQRNAGRHQNPLAQQENFRESSRRAFFNLEPRVRSPLLPEEERRQIWLAKHHRQHHQDERNSDNEIHSEKPVIRLESDEVSAIGHANHTCTSSLFKHKIKLAGCKPVTIINRYCHGSCTSFYIPQIGSSSKKQKAAASFRTVSACVPSEYDSITVKLSCPDREEKEIYRKVMKVKNCACRNIDSDDNGESEN